MTASFYGDFERFEGRVALVAEGGRETSYRELGERADRARAALGGERRLVFVELERSPAAIAAYLGALRGGHAVLPFARDDAAKIGALAATFRAHAIVRAQGDELDVAWRHREPIALHPELRLLLSTSGTTGSPKLVKLSRANLQSNAEAIVEYLALSPDERAFTTLKLNYSYGLSVLHSHLACGASLALSDVSVGDERFWQSFEALGATSFAGVPHTFEMLRTSGDSWARTRGLRHVTQAGGRLAPDLVRHVAELAARAGWRFFVMYGQTEAAPRIAYLPPEHARRFPHCIGIAVPGGEIALVDERGHFVDEPGVPGELFYRGPNVMLGYATSAAELASDETPAWLRTGDVASRATNGLFQIVGRRARFVKPFGLRVNLDEVELHTRALEPEALCAGNDERIVIALPGVHDDARVERIAGELATRYALPEGTFQVVFAAELPRLTNGKPDYRALVELAAPAPRSTRGTKAGWRDIARLVLSRRFAAEVWNEARGLLGLSATGWNSVSEIYATLLRAEHLGETDSFVSLRGDSLSYVEAAVALERYLGELPAGWPALSVRELEERRANVGAL